MKTATFSTNVDQLLQKIIYFSHGTQKQQTYTTKYYSWQNWKQMEIHESWKLTLAKPQLVRFAVQRAPEVSKMLLQFVQWTCNTGETDMLMRFEIFMVVKPYSVIFWVMTLHYMVGGYNVSENPAT